jgi:hypothetical protein
MQIYRRLQRYIMTNLTLIHDFFQVNESLDYNRLSHVVDRNDGGKMYVSSLQACLFASF